MHCSLPLIGFLLVMGMYTCVPSCRREFGSSKNLAIHEAKCQLKIDYDTAVRDALAAKLVAKKARTIEKMEARQLARAAAQSSTVQEMQWEVRTDNVVAEVSIYVVSYQDIWLNTQVLLVCYHRHH